jgi:hypothetical protein
MEKKGDVITMKKRSRLFAILLAMVMVLSLMPSLAFAGDSHEQTWYPSKEDIDVSYNDAPVTLTLPPISGDTTGFTFTYSWFFWNDSLGEYTWIPGTGTSNTVSQLGNYKCTITDQYGNYDSVWFYVAYDHRYTYAGGMYFSNNTTTTATVSGSGYEQGSQWIDTPVGVAVIPATITLNDGKVYTVNRIGSFFGNKTLTGAVLPETITKISSYAFESTGLTSITIPAGVTEIGKCALGYNEVKDAQGNYVDVLVPGFVIFGKTGTAAHAYAINNGIAFRDPEAEWNGTPDGKISKAKASKPKASKKSFTIKWKKLSKKQLKKGGVTNYEVQYSLNKAFPMNETTTKYLSKKKGSCKVKKLLSKKTYYVRVRAIRNVGGVKYVGSWSTKKVKVK